LILGISALVTPLAVRTAVLKRDGAAVLLSAALFGVAAFTVGFERSTGVAFLVLLAGYVAYAFRQERVGATGSGHTAAFEKAEAVEGVDPALRPIPDRRVGAAAWMLPALMALVGLGIVVLGGRLLVDGAVTLARELGLSEDVIGLTIVAVGTSMPELVTSIVAAFRKQSDVAVGNVLGSNIYNALGIGGATALISPTDVLPREIVSEDVPVMIAVSALLFLCAWTGKRISRVEGGTFIALYAAYVFRLLGR
jgi:cation:H+ antiporter